MSNDDSSKDEVPLRLGTILIWPAMAIAALVAFTVLVIGSVWLFFQDLAYPESVAVRGMIIVLAIAGTVTAWRKRQR